MKRPFAFVFPILSLALTGVLGCAYTLKYVISSEVEPQAYIASTPKTFAVKNELKRGKAQFPMEKKLLRILSRSFIDMGWSPVAERDAAFVFTVRFKRPFPEIYPEIGFTPYPGRGYDTEGDPKYYTGAHSDEYSITITAKSQGMERQYIWSVTITAVSSATNLLELARFTIPEAISRFPETGYWELREKVSPRGE
jgi:hypothetical protein